MRGLLSLLVRHVGQITKVSTKTDFKTCKILLLNHFLIIKKNIARGKLFTISCINVVLKDRISISITKDQKNQKERTRNSDKMSTFAK